MMLNITTKIEQEIMIVDVAGRLDAATADEMTQTLTGIIEKGHNYLVLDMHALEYISSAGLRTLLMAGKRLSASGGKMVLCSLLDYIDEIFEIAGFGQIFSIVKGRSEAIAAF